MCKPCVITALLFLAVVAGAFFYLWNEAYAAGEIVINEIQLSDNEFVELYNPGDSNINLANYYFAYYSSTRTEWSKPYRLKQFPENAEIPANGYYLIGFKGYAESGTPAADWQPYTSNQLSNSRGTVAIFSQNPEEANATPVDAIGWGEVKLYMGSPVINLPSAEESLSRDLSHANTQNNAADFSILINPTPANSSNFQSPEPTSEPEPTPEPEPEPEPEPVPESEPEPEPEPPTETSDQQQETSENTEEESSEPEFIKTNNIIISEFMLDPVGRDSENEWIELYNKGSKIINISGWFLDDIEGGSKPFELPEGTTILPDEYRIFSIKLTKIALNNNGDAVRLLYPDGSVADKIEYGDDVKEGYSYALVSNNWTWTDNPTPGYENEGPTQETVVRKQETVKTKKTTGGINATNDDSSDEDSYEEKETLTTEEFSAQIATGSSGPNGFLPFIFGILIAVGGGAAFFILKRKQQL